GNNPGGTNSPTFMNSFTYDQKDRLVSATSAGTNGSVSMWATETYTFDDIHRMRTRTIGGTTYTYGYPAGSRAQARAQAHTWTHPPTTRALRTSTMPMATR
ncbi:MAG: hypothetical protein M3328_01720, partial [Chloroflexota bacterium]|nr:hypothetical protein [Chloroflexota bacterium]